MIESISVEKIQFLNLKFVILVRVQYSLYFIYTTTCLSVLELNIVINGPLYRILGSLNFLYWQIHV